MARLVVLVVVADVVYVPARASKPVATGRKNRWRSDNLSRAIPH